MIPVTSVTPGTPATSAPEAQGPRGRGLTPPPRAAPSSGSTGDPGGSGELPGGGGLHLDGRVGRNAGGCWERGVQCGVKRCPAWEPLDPSHPSCSAHSGWAALQVPLPLWRPHAPRLHFRRKRPQEVVGPGLGQGPQAQTIGLPSSRSPRSLVHPGDPPALCPPYSSLSLVYYRECGGGRDEGRAPEPSAVEVPCKSRAGWAGLWYGPHLIHHPQVCHHSQL